MKTFAEFEHFCALLRYSDIDPKQDVTLTVPRGAFDAVLADYKSIGFDPVVSTRIILRDSRVGPSRGRTVTLTY